MISELDLKKRSFKLDEVGNFPKQGGRYAILGYPIAHSLSPFIYNPAFEFLGRADKRFEDSFYSRIEVAPGEIAQALKVLHKEKFLGLNLTIPHKVDAIRFLYQIDPQAQVIGSVNTLVWKPEGYKGYNTDLDGFMESAKNEIGFNPQGAKVILLGAGGAARAAAVGCVLGGCQELWIGNRSPDRLNIFMSTLSELALNYGVFLKKFDLNNPGLAKLPRKNVTIIQATAAGLNTLDSLPMNLNYFDDSSNLFFEMIYSPSETLLLKQARLLGMQATNGLGMLIHQANQAFQLWTGHALDITTTQARLLKLL